MARYEREFLVPYLEDICALQLSKQKLMGLISGADKEIARINQNALKEVGEPELEEYRQAEQMDGVGTIGIGLILGIGAILTFFGALFSGEMGMLLIAVPMVLGEIYLIFQGSSAKDRKNEEIKKRNDERERDHALAQMASLVAAEPKVKAVAERMSVYEQEIEKVEMLLENLYSVNVIPRWYRDLYPAVYLYDWFSNSRADDLDVALNTLVLEQIKDRLDTIIRNQGEMIINQRIMMANQQKSMEQMERHHAELVAKLNQIEASNEEQAMYLSMIEGNTAANAYFSAANYLKQ